MEYDGAFLSLYVHSALLRYTRISEIPETDGKFILEKKVSCINAFKPWK